MYLRCCVYKNCENFINPADRTFSKPITLFGFPKDTERRQKWIEYGQVPSGLPPSQYYFCSDHFDKKFFGINNRRTILVGEAVPFPYVESEADENFQADSTLDYYLYETNKDDDAGDNQQIDNENNLYVESTTPQPSENNSGNREECKINLNDRNSETGTIIMHKSKVSKDNVKCHKVKKDNCVLMKPSSSKSKTNKILQAIKTLNTTNNKNEQTITLKEFNIDLTTTLDNISNEIYEEQFSIDLEDLEGDRYVPTTSKNNLMQKPYKRKIEGNNQAEDPLFTAKVSKKSSTVKILEIPQNISEEEQIAVESIENVEEEAVLENLVDGKHVTTFIFKGEEYVQMPKDYYIREKFGNIKKFKEMVRTVQTIKEYINSIDV